jgi:hypothetical protein
MIGPMPWYAWLWCVAMAVLIVGIFWCCHDMNKILKEGERYR